MGPVVFFSPEDMDEIHRELELEGELLNAWIQGCASAIWGSRGPVMLEALKHHGFDFEIVMFAFDLLRIENAGAH